jgi:glycosyltransferase involved in cell wall biosynthesis
VNRSQDFLASIVIPVFNGERYLTDALESALSQTHQNLEVIVVNDGSTDDTASIAARYAQLDPRIKLIQQRNQGLSAARNTGLHHAQGSFVGFLDHDDALDPHKLERQITYLNDHPDCGLVYGDYLWADANLQPLHTVHMDTPPVPLGELYLYRNWFTPVVPLLRHTLIERVGGFDEQLHGAEDWDYWLRCSRHTSFGYAPGVVALYRTHENQMHRDMDRMRKARLQVLRKHFAPHTREYRLGLASIYWNEIQFFKPRREFGPILTAAKGLLETRVGLPQLREIARINAG